MHFESLSIRNFRGIKFFEVTGLSDFVMIAGPNGCGKSCVFDAIRLLKSAYGGYQQNEWHHFFSELQININSSVDTRRLFRDPGQPLQISATLRLDESEQLYITENAAEILEPYLWTLITGQDAAFRRYARAGMLIQNPAYIEALQEAMKVRLPALLESLQSPLQKIRITIDPPLYRILPEPNDVASVLFATYDPGNLGLIEYHSASRTYTREALGGIDLNERTFEEQKRQSTLYNSEAKYTNIKSELAATYLRGLVAKAANKSNAIETVNDTLKSLFSQFFPDKEYLGVQPDISGTLSFPVQLTGGETHDINELSSGEKEILYGYLRLKNSAPKYSAILLDEPELHLNPGLLRGLVRFYYENLGKAGLNQLWLVTHSDALLRQAVENTKFSVFHMTPSHATDSSENQAVPVLADDELQRATIAMVGDLATYKPTARVVIVEGGGKSEFDAEVISQLAPDFTKRVNLISGGSKARAQGLRDALAHAGEQLGGPGRFFAIVDHDFDTEDPPENAQVFKWDVYHIENYLLVDEYIQVIVNGLLGRDRFTSESAVASALLGSARQIVEAIVLERTRQSINKRIVDQVKIGVDSKQADASLALSGSLRGTFKRLRDVQQELEDTATVSTIFETERQTLSASLEDQSWRKLLPGRMLLKRFTNDFGENSFSYESLRNLILRQMAKDKFQPEGFAKVLAAVLDARIN